MRDATSVLEIHKPHFTVRLYEDLLKIDLRGTVKNEIEEALENKPVIRETIGRILGIFVPLHIRLSDVDSVRMEFTENLEYTGNVTIVLPHHRDVNIPLEQKEALQLVKRMNQIIQRPRTKSKKLKHAHP
jgi:hypothetical protein